MYSAIGRSPQESSFISGVHQIDHCSEFFSSYTSILHKAYLTKTSAQNVVCKTRTVIIFCACIAVGLRLGSSSQQLQMSLHRASLHSRGLPGRSFRSTTFRITCTSLVPGNGKSRVSTFEDWHVLVIGTFSNSIKVTYFDRNHCKSPYIRCKSHGTRWHGSVKQFHSGPLIRFSSR